MSAGVAIFRIRRARGLRQAELAAKLGVTQTCISYWEAGKRQPGVDDLEVLGAALGVPAAVFVSEPRCAHCYDMPPPGFRCLACAREEAPMT